MNHGGLRSRSGRTSEPSTFSTSMPPGLARERVALTRLALAGRARRRASTRRRSRDAEALGEHERWRVRAPRRSGRPCARESTPGRACASAAELARRSRSSRTSGSPQATTHENGSQVVVDVDGEAVRGDAARDVHADRGDLAVLAPTRRCSRGRPRGARAPRCPPRRARRRSRRSIVRRCATTSSTRHDRVADELAGAVVGDAPAAVGRRRPRCRARGRSPRRAAARPSARAPAARVDGRVLEQQQRVGQLPGLAARAERSCRASASR